MAQVSRRYLDEKTKQRIFSLFVSAIVSCNSKESAALFIEDLFTPTEKIMLSKRLSIAFMLLNNYDYRTISDTLKVSLATIGNVSLWLKNKGMGLKNTISKIKKREEMRKIWEEIADAVEEIMASAPGRNWSQSKKQLYKNRLKRQKAF